MKFLSLASKLSIFAFHTTYLFAGGDATKGKSFYNVCMSCHGFNGEGNLATKSPPLAGQEDWYIVTQLKKFKQGTRGTSWKDYTGKQMRPMSMTLPDEKAMEDVAAHIQTLKKRKVNTTLGGDEAKGGILYKNCSACHGPAAQGNPQLKAPALKQLPDWYIVAQLKKFKEGLRGTHLKDIEGMQMRVVSMNLENEKAMADVAAFINSLQ